MTPNRSDICAVLRSEILDGKYNCGVRFEKLGGSRRIGLLVPGPDSNLFYAGIVKGAVEKCRELGLGVREHKG